jgi:hypothetical protein
MQIVLFNDAVNYWDDGDEALVEWYWQRETEVLGDKPVPEPFCSPYIPHRMDWD